MKHYWGPLTFGRAATSGGANDRRGGSQTSAVMSAAFSSDEQDVRTLVSICYDISVNPGANAVTGTLKIQGSNGSTSSQANQANQPGAGGSYPGPNWYDAGDSVAVSLAASTPGAFNLIVDNFPYAYARLSWVGPITGGTTCTMTAMSTNKGVALG